MKNNRFLVLPEEPTTVISHKFTGSASKVSGSVDKSRRIVEEARLEKTCMEESPNRPGGLFCMPERQISPFWTIRPMTKGKFYVMIDASA